jgi:mRNA interferase RelE/StbE
LAYEIRFAPAARRQFRKLPAEAQGRIAPRIDALGRDPRPAGAKRLRGVTDLWRIRAGTYRVVYNISDEAVEVLVVRVAHRRDAYRGL